MSAERDLTPDMVTEITAKSLAPIILMEGEFATGTARFWSGYGTLSWNGADWSGLGHLVELSPIEESTEIAAKGFSVRLGGQDPATLSLALAACRQGKPGRFWLGALNAAGAVVGNPYLLRRGRLDAASGTDAGESASISVTYEDRMTDLERAREYRYTTESQRLFYPNDLGFEFVPSLQDVTDVWHP